MDRHHHTTTEEQTGNTWKFVPFVTSQTLYDQITVAALLNKHQTYTKLYMLLLTFGVLCHSNNVLLTYIALKVILKILINTKQKNYSCFTKFG